MSGSGRSTRTLSEHAAKAKLAAFGIPVVDERLVDDADAAVAAAEEIGYPVAVKLCGDALAHKTERGLVHLGLGDAAAVRRAADAVLAAARPEDDATGVLVAPMVRGTRELIAGLHADPQFGMCVMLGVGGVLAEALADVVFRLVPLSRVDAEEMIGDLRTQALLGGFRGEPPVDRGRLADVLVGLSDFALAEPGVVGADLNPLVVADGVPVAVDALIEVGG